MKKALIISTLLALAGCGTIGSRVISDESLQEKAAFALDTTADQVKISNRRGDMSTVRFVASVGEKSYQCYVGTSVVITSDAICSGSNSVKNSGDAKASPSCNALLKAAGRC